MVEQVGRDVRSPKVGERVGLGYLRGVCGECRPCLTGLFVFSILKILFGFCLSQSLQDRDGRMGGDGCCGGDDIDDDDLLTSRHDQDGISTASTKNSTGAPISILGRLPMAWFSKLIAPSPSLMRLPLKTRRR